MCPIPSGVGTVGALSPLSAVPRAPLGEQPCAARHCPALPPPGGAAGGLAVRAQGRRRRPCPRRSPPASRRRRGAANGAARGACRPGPAPPVFTGREAPPPCQRSAPAVPPLRPQPGTGPQPQRWPRDGCARGRAAPRWRLWRAARPCLRGGLWRAGKWIAIPATSSSGCNWSCAPWPSCSPEVRAAEPRGRLRGARRASGERLRAALGASGRTSVGVAGSPAGAARGRPPGTAALGGLGQGEPLRRGTWLFWKAGCN